MGERGPWWVRGGGGGLEGAVVGWRRRWRVRGGGGGLEGAVVG